MLSTDPDKSTRSSSADEQRKLAPFAAEALGCVDDYAVPIDSILSMAATRAPQDTALVWKDGTLSFAAFDRAVSARAEALTHWFGRQFDRSIHGQRIGVFAQKDPGTILLLFAALRAGAIVVPLNPALKADQFDHIASSCSMAAGFVPKRLVAALDKVPGSGASWVENDTLIAGAPDYNDLSGWSHRSHTVATAQARAPEDTSLLFYTSGSTGLPKGVMVSHHSCVLGAASVAHYLNLRAHDRVMALLPLSFDYGFNQLVSTWMAGGSVVLHDFFIASDVPKAVDRFNVTGLAAVPPLWHLLMDAKWPAGAQDTLRYVTNSGGKLTPALQQRLRQTLPNADIFAMYGLTEAFRSTFLNPHRLSDKPTSIGKPVPFANVFLLAEDLTSAAPGSVGELVHTGPLVAQGYWNDPEKTAKRFRPVPEILKPHVDERYHGRCVFSGDFAFTDDDGDLHFVGRRDEMIKVLGNRLSPQEIEDCACLHEGIKNAVAFGVDDERMGAKICLVVEVGTSTNEIWQTLGDMLRTHLPSYAIPTFYFAMTEFARSANGKIDRPSIKQWADAQRAAGKGQL